MRPGAALRALRVTCAATLLAPRAHAQQQAVGDFASRVDRIFARFDRATPGCGVGLAKDGRTLYTHGYGSANLEYGVPNTDSTVFESGSVAKQFTAAAIVLLAQDGKLSLDDDIRKYLPEVPSFGGQRITIRNLLTHTSGLRDQWGLLGIEGRGPGTQVHSPMTTLDLVVHQKMLNFPPGSEYLYSNTGYALAEIIVQRVSGKSFSEFTQERLFRPLGMTHTQWRDDFTTVVPNRATAYNGNASIRISHRHAVHEHDRQRRVAQHDGRSDAVEREPRPSDRRRPSVRRRDADADASHQRTHDHLRARTRRQRLSGSQRDQPRAVRRRAIERSSRAIRISVSPSRCGATTRARTPRRWATR